MNSLIGVILCGGQSKRMGRDKGLIEETGKHWAVMMAEKLLQLDISLIVSINNTQIDTYQKIFPTTPLVVDNLEVAGPLNGLLSVHQEYPDKNILLLATDMLDMDLYTIHQLVSAYKNHKGFDFYAFEQDGFCQSFCSIFTANALSEIIIRLKKNELSKFSLHERFKEGETYLIPITNNAAFNNYNQLS